MFPRQGSCTSHGEWSARIGFIVLKLGVLIKKPWESLIWVKLWLNDIWMEDNIYSLVNWSIIKEFSFKLRRQGVENWKLKIIDMGCTAVYLQVRSLVAIWASVVTVKSLHLPVTVLLSLLKADLISKVKSIEPIAFSWAFYFKHLSACIFWFFLTYMVFFTVYTQNHHVKNST